METSKHPDATLIEKLGGAAQLAQLLGFDPAKGGVQRVDNWTRRGIPAKVKLEHASVFRRATKAKAEA